QDIFIGLGSFQSSIDIWSPYGWNFKRDYAIAVAGQYFNYPGTVSNEDVLKAVKAMEEVRDEHPEDAFNHYALINVYNEVASINKEKYTQEAEAEAKIALEISPGRQEIYFYLAKTKTIEGDYAGALSLLKTALDENPNVPDSHFYYGLLAYATGDNNTGYNEVKTAMAMGRQWSTFNEPRVIAGFFADSGHLAEAIELYKTAWDMSSHSDIDSEIKLGVAYFYQKQYAEAKSYLEDAVGRIDITKSPSYAQLEPIFRQLGINPVPPKQ
ncbi:MAG TPA: tetratricopeptide repeat protein, partial [Candidatus Paceibacterota bacterium]|nr:tetratricopeptide repeat protein [Candidatus Paceibacterota bacterium]